MKKKGFTLVELIVSFCLVSSIVVILFQLIFTLKELYISGDIKTMMLNKQGIITRKIYEELNSKELIEIKACGISCLTFSFGDGTESELLIDVAANTISYGNYTMELSEGSSIGNVSFDTGAASTGASNSTVSDRVFKISIPIKAKLLPDDDFGIYIVKNYNSNKLTMTNANKISVDKATIVANNIKLNVETMTVPVDVDYTSTSTTTGYFMKIYNENNNNNFNTTEALKYYDMNNTSSFSSLVSLSSFKSTSRRDEILTKLKENIEVSSANSNQDILDQAKEHLQNGYFELVYGTNSDINNNNYFIQGNDVTKKKDISEFIAMDLIDSSFIGLKYDTMMTETISNQKLWIRVDDYIEKYGFIKLKNITQ